MAKKYNCMEVLGVDSELARLDKLHAIYQLKMDGIAQSKADVLARKNEMIQAGCCIPIVTDKKDPITGQLIGKNYEHNYYCKFKGDKLGGVK